MRGYNRVYLNIEPRQQPCMRVVGICQHGRRNESVRKHFPGSRPFRLTEGLRVRCGDLIRSDDKRMIAL